MIKQRLQDDMKAALKGGDKRKLGVIRLILAAIKQREVDERTELNDPEVLAVLDKMVKQRRDSATQYEAAGRAELAEQEHYEIAILQGYLPQPLTEAELAQLVSDAIVSTGAASPQDMGKVMGHLKPRIQGRADMSVASALVKKELGG